MEDSKVRKEFVQAIVDLPEFKKASIKGKIRLLDNYIQTLNRDFDSYKISSNYVQERILNIMPSAKNDDFIMCIESEIKDLNLLKDDLEMKQLENKANKKRIKNERKT